MTSINNIQDIKKYLKDNNIDFKNLPITKYEKFGNTIFPVTYHSDGIITIDYPERPFKDSLR